MTEKTKDPEVPPAEDSKVEAPKKETNHLGHYYILEPIFHGRSKLLPAKEGMPPETIDLTDAQAAPLLKAGAIEPVVDVKPAKAAEKAKK